MGHDDDEVEEDDQDADGKAIPKDGKGGDSDEVDNLQKASYYYQQALLVFYYLIPDTDAETLESDTLKLEC